MVDEVGQRDEQRREDDERHRAGDVGRPEDRHRGGGDDRGERHPVRVARNRQHGRIGDDAPDLDEAPQHRRREAVPLGQALGDQRVVGRVRERRPRDDRHGHGRARPARRQEEDEQVASAGRHRGAVYRRIDRRPSDGSTVSAARPSGDPRKHGYDRRTRVTTSAEATHPTPGVDIGRIFDVPWYPMLFAAAWVLNLWVETGVSVLAMARSLAIVVIGVALVLVVATLVTRRAPVAGAITIVAFGLLVSRDPLHALAIVVLAVAVPLAVWLWAARIRQGHFSWQRLTRALNLFGSIMLLVVLAGGIGRGTLASVPSDLRQGNGALRALPGARERGGGPARHPCPAAGRVSPGRLVRAALRRRQQRVPRGAGGEGILASPARARRTTCSPSSRWRRCSTCGRSPEIAELEPIFSMERHTGHPRLRNTLNDNPGVRLPARARVPHRDVRNPGYEHVALRQSDVYLDGGQLNDFEYELLRSTTIERILLGLEPSFLADQKRDRVRDGFDAFTASAAGTGSPDVRVRPPFRAAPPGGLRRRRRRRPPPSVRRHLWPGGRGPAAGRRVPRAAGVRERADAGGHRRCARTASGGRGADHHRHVRPRSGEAPAGVRERRDARPLREPLRSSHAGCRGRVPRGSLAHQHLPAPLQSVLRWPVRGVAGRTLSVDRGARERALGRPGRLLPRPRAPRRVVPVGHDAARRRPRDLPARRRGAVDDRRSVRRERRSAGGLPLSLPAAAGDGDPDPRLAAAVVHADRHRDRRADRRRLPRGGPAGLLPAPCSSARGASSS